MKKRVIKKMNFKKATIASITTNVAKNIYGGGTFITHPLLCAPSDNTRCGTQCHLHNQN
jgi:hypothetical protein